MSRLDHRGQGSALAPDDRRGWIEKPAELQELYATMDSASLFGGRWRLRPEREIAQAGISEEHASIRVYTTLAYVFADLEDGRRAAYFSVRVPQPPEHPRWDWWVALLEPDEALHLDAPVIAKGIDTFFLRVLDEGDAPFVDHPGFVADGRVRDGVELTRAG